MTDMTVFGPSWAELELGDLEAFLRGAPAEPLLWEGKADMRPERLRKHVTGFANGHDVGYLILGADQHDDGTWTLDGIKFPTGDPPNDITNLIANRGVTPYPDGLDVRPFEVGDAKHVAVVRIPPVATPPCNTGGTVYERVSGKTIPVTDPARLAELIHRGDDARRAAEEKAHSAALRVLERAPAEPENVAFAVGIAAAGYAPDISSRLFSERFKLGLQSSIETVLVGDERMGSAGTRIEQRVTQEAIMLRSAAIHRVGWSWTVRGSWDGALGVHWTMAVPRTSVEVVVSQALRAALLSAREVLDMLAPSGPRYLHAIVKLGETQLVYSGFPGTEPTPDRLTVKRVLVPGADFGEVLDSIGRELERATGIMVYEDGEQGRR